MSSFWDEARDKNYADLYGVSLEKAAQERQHQELMRSLDSLNRQKSGRKQRSFLFTDDERKDLIERSLALREAQTSPAQQGTVGPVVKFIGAMLVLPLGVITANMLDVQAGAGIFIMLIIWGAACLFVK